MNSLLQSLASEEWACVVKALLHTLWLGGLAAGGLFFVLRGKSEPVTRHRCCVAALFAVVLGGIAAWAVLQQRPIADHPSSEMTSTAPISSHRLDATPVDSAAVRAGPVEVAQPGRWTPWLAMVWLGGAAVMLGRAGWLVVEAEKLRRRSSPLENETVLKLIEEARRKMGLARRIQAVVTEQLTSPAVMGLVTPVLILPLSMVTTQPMEQLQLILLHELAHIRRGDYLVNLCQLLVESLLFFNPAVWWISRQIRQEREACCDAVAVALAGERLQFARTLAQAAGEALAAAPAFGDRRNPSGLKDRIQRLLVPGYRPALQLTWRALLAALFAGGGLLFLSALGARVTVAAILSPQERIERIEKKMAEFGEKPGPADHAAWEKMPRITVSGHVRMADGTPVPEWVSIDLVSMMGRSYSGTAITAHNGFFSDSIPPGTIVIGGEATHYAPAEIGPLDGLATNRLENLELVFAPGFNATIELVDEDSGKPVADGRLTVQYWLRGAGQTSFRARALTADENGTALLTHAADLPLDVTVNVPGHEIFKQHFESVQPDKPLRIALRAGAKASVSGVVLDKLTGRPVAGAELHLLYQEGQHFEWDDSLHLLGRTDARGAFAVDQLRSGASYYIGISAPGHESVILSNIISGQSNLIARVGPELVVRGRVIGSLESLQQIDGGPVLYRSFSEVYDNGSYDNGANVFLHPESGATRFRFTNRVAGLVRISARSGGPFEREVDGPVDDWVIDLNQTPKTKAMDLPKREVIFRFKDPSGVPPRGTVSVTLPDNLDIKHLTAHNLEMEITNGEVRAQIAIGGRTSIEPKRMAGYWFDRFGERGSLLSIEVTNGPGPMVIEIPLVPAGAIYAKARNADGTPAGGLMFGADELKRAPGVDTSTLLGNDSDGFSDNAPRKWVSGPLPLGGTYQIYGWRGNLFCVSKPVKLTEANPDAEIELQFPPGKTFDGVALDVNGKPLRDAELKVSFALRAGHGFGLKSVFTDERGRFRIENMTPEFGGYSVEADAPGAMSEIVKLDFGSQPQTMRLKRGRSLAGRVVEAGTGRAIPNAELRAGDFEGQNLPVLATRTDADGRFEFTTLGDGNYTFYSSEGQLLTDKKFRADGSTNVVLAVKLYAWSKVKPGER
jgi:beta-lactamase regulating signal transducer with metallopeptidase domain